MKVIILAGGYGSRLGNITDTIPKPMLKIGRKPIIWHIMKCYAHYGYKDFIISCGYKSEVIKEYFYNYDMYSNDFTINMTTKDVTFHPSNDAIDWSITLADTGLNTLKGARIKRLRHHLVDDTNMLTYGDAVSNIDLKALVEFHNSHNKIFTVTGVHPPSRFGEIIERDSKLVSFLEKPQTSIGLINGGFMVFNKKLLDFLSTEEDSDLEYGPFEALANIGEIMVYHHNGLWECVDTERDLRHLQRLWEEGKAFWKIWG